MISLRDVRKIYPGGVAALAGVTLDRKVLSDIAIRDEAGFAKLCEQAKASLPHKPQSQLAEMHRGMAEPGSGKQQ